MPARSNAQQRYLYAHFGADWVKKHHFDNETKGLPPHIAKATAVARKKKRHKHG